MKEHITFVYYDSQGHAGAFHVTDAYPENLHGVFLDHDVQSIKNITIETDSWAGKKFKTLFTEPDIAAFIKERKLDY